MSDLKCLKIGALVYHSWVAMRQSKSKDCPKVTLGNIPHAIIEEVVGLVNISRDGGELEKPQTNQRDRKYVHRRREGNTGVQGIGIHVNGKLGGSLCQRHPEDDSKDSNTVDGNGRAVKRDSNCCQSTRRGERDRDDNRHMESGLGLKMNVNSCAEHAAKGKKLSKNCKECAGEGCSCNRRETGTMQPAKVMAMASPWFVGVGENLVARK